jgi:hypothetical protein
MQVQCPKRRRVANCRSRQDADRRCDRVAQTETPKQKGPIHTEYAFPDRDARRYE